MTAGGAATSAPSVDAPLRVEQQPIESARQSADANQATLLAISSILDQKLTEQREQLQEQSDKQLEARLREQREQQELL